MLKNHKPLFLRSSYPRHINKRWWSSKSTSAHHHHPITSKNTNLPKVCVKDITFNSSSPISSIATAFREFGCVVVSGLNDKYVPQILDDVLTLREQTIQLFNHNYSKNLKEGVATPDGSLLIPMGKGDYDSYNPENQKEGQKWQIMVLGLDYYSSSTLLKASIDEKLLDIVEGILGDPNIELFGKGQVLLKEPEGGHAKYFHQDAAYFEFKDYGPIGTLNYCVETSKALKNGVLHVYPGSHRLKYIPHVDTHSHLALPLEQWPWEDSLALDGHAGDCILFHQYLIHGSPNNLSTSPRPVFINRYIQANDAPIMPQATRLEDRLQHMKNYEAGKQFEKDLGYMVRGRRIIDAKNAGKSAQREKQFH